MSKSISEIAPSQLNAIVDTIKNKNIVLLAEQSHISEELSAVRIDIIKKCHKMYDFKCVAFELTSVNLWTMMNKIINGDKQISKLTKIGLNKIWQTEIVSSLVKYATETDLYIMSYDVVQTLWQADFIEFFKECNKYITCDYEHYVKMFNQIRALYYNVKINTDFLNMEHYSENGGSAITHNKNNYAKLKKLEKRYLTMLDQLEMYLKQVSKKITNKYHRFVLENISNMLHIDWDNWMNRQYIINHVDASEYDTWYVNMHTRDCQGSKFLTNLFKTFKEPIFVWNHLVHSYNANLRISLYIKSLESHKRSHLKPLGYWFKKRNTKGVYVLEFLHGKGHRKQLIIDKETLYEPDISTRTGEKEYTYELAEKYKQITFVPKSKLKRIPVLLDQTWVIPYNDFDGAVFVPRISLPKMIK